MKWWGWGDPAHEPRLPAHALAFLEAELGARPDRRDPVALEAVRLPESSLPASARDRLVAAGGEVRDDREARVVHAAGKSYPDLVRQRSGELEHAPDAVVHPGDRSAVAGLLEACAREGVAVVPFGGGTSVVGGVAPLRGSFPAVVSLDLSKLDELIGVDAVSRTAVIEAGVALPDAERLLAPHGFTLGHFPQSFEYATVGGCVATRSAGQASTGYGRIEELVRGLHVATPAGPIEPRTLPATAAGPDLRQLLVGSEGVLGVITSAALQVAPRPVVQRFEGWWAPSFETGAAALRELRQEEVAPAVARLSDETETRLSLALAGEGLGARLMQRYVAARGREGGCLMVLGWEGEPEQVAVRRRAGRAILGRAGALALGSAPGRAWARQRFETPYVRDDMLAHGVLVETLETAAQWSSLLPLHGAVRAALDRALRARGTPPLVACHVSHLYETGASLYFTFMARQEEGAQLDQWRAAKSAACEAILAAGGTLTHHHAIGADHAPWLPQEVGELGVEVLGAAKAILDPTGILNPGKLLRGATGR
jgi:alkyldihydroxyacetonephosphate synthase